MGAKLDDQPAYNMIMIALWSIALGLSESETIEVTTCN